MKQEHQGYTVKLHGNSAVIYSDSTREVLVQIEFVQEGRHEKVLVNSKKFFNPKDLRQPFGLGEDIRADVISRIVQDLKANNFDVEVI